MTSVRGMVIEPASSLTNFLEMYSQNGVATDTLQSLIGVYNSQIRPVPVQHCASQNLCQQRLGAPADIAAARCPLCLWAVHLQCGMKHRKYSPGTTEFITCYLCYQHYGTAFDGDEDVLITPRTPGVLAQLQKERDAAKTASIVAARVVAATASAAAAPVAQHATTQLVLG
jgi:hypothetical protein